MDSSLCIMKWNANGLLQHKGRYKQSEHKKLIFGIAEYKELLNELNQSIYPWKRCKICTRGFSVNPHNGTGIVQRLKILKMQIYLHWPTNIFTNGP